MVMSSSDAGPTPAPPGVTGAKGSKLKTCKVEGTDKDPEGAESEQSNLGLPALSLTAAPSPL